MRGIEEFYALKAFDLDTSSEHHGLGGTEDFNALSA